jgi:ATP-dependent RNA helicase HelY
MTEAGRVLASIYHESDLLVAEALRRGLFDGLDPDALAGVVSAFTYEARSSADNEPPQPRQRTVVERLDQLGELAGDLRAAERRVGLRRTRRPDPGLARAVVSWARGATLDSVLAESVVAPGDFVRNVRQLIDLLRQVAQVAPDPRTGGAAELAVALLRRGVVGADDPAAPGSAPPPPAPS